MSNGNLLYLAMTIAVFVVFGGMLAYQSWEQSKLGPETLGEQREPADALRA